jgi:hypothetical protein
MFEDGSRVTVIIPDVEVTGNNKNGGRLKLSKDAIDIRAAKVYCKNCLDITGHFLKDHKDET